MTHKAACNPCILSGELLAKQANGLNRRWEGPRPKPTAEGGLGEAAVLRHAVPVAAVVVEFAGGPGAWVTKTYTASRNGGAFMDGKPICVSRCHDLRRSLLVSRLTCAILTLFVNFLCSSGEEGHFRFLGGYCLFVCLFLEWLLF
jgi:hypothetical protein